MQKTWISTTVSDTYSVNFYVVDQFDAETPLYQGDVIEKSTGQRVFKSDYYFYEHESIDACYDWIDEQEDK